MANMTLQRFRKKWKELEKKFKQEYGKALVKPSGSGTDEIYRPTFPFYVQLQFLSSICETDETRDSIEEPSNPKPRKRPKRQMQEEREERKLELMSEAIQAIKETPAPTRMQFRVVWWKIQRLWHLELM